MDRAIKPELLDTLPPDHPDARRNRRDLRLTNLVMGNHRWAARTVARHVRRRERVLEIGAGTGELGRRISAAGIPIDGLDVWPRPDSWPASLDWHRADLRSFGGWARYAIVVGNLILHQFQDAELEELGGRFGHARVIIACEPVRRRVSQWAYRLLAPLFGANQVSLHDAHVSIAAGFLGRELPALLRLSEAAWNIRCSTTLTGSYRMVAVRRR